MLGWPTCSFVNARVITPHGEANSIRFRRRVLSLDSDRMPAITSWTSTGAWSSGLVNAHDHLGLNHYGPLKVRERYDNATAWLTT